MVIHKRPLQFSLLKYGLITGLNCSSTYPAIPEEDGFRRSYFFGMSTGTLVYLRARIDEFDGEIGVEANVEKIKLASLYFVSVVLGPRRKMKKEEVDPQWTRLVYDMDSFSTYPWGRFAYEKALFDLRKDLGSKFKDFTNLVKKRKRDPKFSGFGSLHISGFVQPLRRSPRSPSLRSPPPITPPLRSPPPISPLLCNPPPINPPPISPPRRSPSSITSQYHGCTEKSPVRHIELQNIVEDKRAQRPVITTGGRLSIVTLLASRRLAPTSFTGKPALQKYDRILLVTLIRTSPTTRNSGDGGGGRQAAALGGRRRRGITDSACKNQLVVVSVQYGPFNTYIPIRSTTIGKSRVAKVPITMHTSWRSNSDIASVTRQTHFDGYHETHLIVTVYSEHVPSRLGRQNEDKAARARD
ncbi:hypothetical protein F511_36187 [Dorcoceras hygrometricum]|uniref:DUF1985 domain-containing protein n=1 Tax=Dorcoceras hygrometricum TaxID=472368 RepID=A0A2Z7B4A0_9LAMI|nr:hypothetical protein F511_36187 [Dorcoceras hygrometricum]